MTATASLLNCVSCSSDSWGGGFLKADLSVLAVRDGEFCIHRDKHVGGIDRGCRFEAVNIDGLLNVECQWWYDVAGSRVFNEIFSYAFRVLVL